MEIKIMNIDSCWESLTLVNIEGTEVWGEEALLNFE